MMEFSLSEAGNLLVIAGIEQRKTEEVIARAEITRSMGIRTIAALPPFGENVPQERIFEHFARIAELDIQILAYNKKLMSGTAIDIETLVRICKIPNIVAVKEGSADPQFTQKLQEAVEGIAILQAWENLLTKTRTHGSIVPLSHLEPELCREALDNPSRELQGRIDSAVSRYNIQAENQSWYSDVKKELVRKGIISTDTLVNR
jgi:4-hydroxy-tetrahydrodipicolinate synthase